MGSNLLLELITNELSNWDKRHGAHISENMCEGKAKE